MEKVTIIRIRRGINGFRYSACDNNGFFICNFDKLSDARKRWAIEIKWGQVKLIRELDKQPDMSKIEATKAVLEGILQSYSKQNQRRGRTCKR